MASRGHSGDPFELHKVHLATGLRPEKGGSSEETCHLTDPTGRRKRPTIYHNNKKNEMKFCKDCKHADERPLITRCTHSESRISPVTGERGAAFIARLEGASAAPTAQSLSQNPSRLW